MLAAAVRIGPRHPGIIFDTVNVKDWQLGIQF